MPIAQVKILKGIAPKLVGIREKRKTYVTSSQLKPFDLLLCLKAMTTAGIIKNYPKQLEEIKLFCKVSKSTFYTRLYQLEKMNLLTITQGTIYLTSWKKIAELYDIDTIEFHTINYDTDKKEQTVEYFLRAIEIEENQQIQLKEAQRKMNKTPELEIAFNSYCNKQNKTAELTLKNLHEIQRETYSTGADDYDVLHSINPDTNRSAKSIKKAYNFHSIRNTAYLKRQLEKRGLATVTHRLASVCRYAEHATIKPVGKRNPVSIGVIVALVMPGISTKKKGSKSHQYTTWYCKKNNARIWREVDKIELNTQLFKN